MSVDRTRPPPPLDPEARPVFQTGELVAGVYEIRSVLGAGGMGEVYEAHDRLLNRRVAVKVVRPGIAPDYLLREGRALAAIHHPGIVTVHWMGTHREVPFLVLEHIRGLSLDRMIDERRLRGERFPLLEALDLLIPTADALSVVHKAGLAHRDVKPGNVMLAPGGRVVLMDFGLVLPHADRAGHKSVAGSLQYMAPEALTGSVNEGGAHLLDVYAFGVLAFEILSGIVPFDGELPLEIYRSKMTKPLPRVSDHRSDLPADVDDLLAQLLAPEAHDRPPSAEAVVWQLRGLRARADTLVPPRPFSALIVDDDPDILHALSLYVRGAAPDAAVETVGEGRLALRSVRRRVPDLLIVDLDLPDMNGVELCMLLRGMDLGQACTLVSVSGRATRADVDLLEQLGVRSYEKGPELMAQLMALVRSMRPSLGAPESARSPGPAGASKRA